METGMPKPFAPDVKEQLGPYVYMLIDPRDGTAFYVGKGRGDRVYQHVWNALGSVPQDSEGHELGEHDSKAVTSAKNARIREIVNAGERVGHIIVRTCDDDKQAYAVEHGVLMAMQLGGGQKISDGLTNIVSGHYRFEFKDHRAEELDRQIGAEPAPPLPVPCAVIKVNAAATVTDEAELYERASKSWRAGGDMRQVVDLPVFVVAHNVIRAVYRARSWDDVGSGGRNQRLYQFRGVRDAELEETYRHLRLTPEDIGKTRWRDHSWHPVRQLPTLDE